MNLIDLIFGPVGRSMTADVARGYVGAQTGKRLAFEESEKRRKESEAEQRAIQAAALRESLARSEAEAARTGRVIDAVSKGFRPATGAIPVSDQPTVDINGTPYTYDPTQSAAYVQRTADDEFRERQIAETERHNRAMEQRASTNAGPASRRPTPQQKPATEAQAKYGMLYPRAAEAYEEMRGFLLKNNLRVPEESRLAKLTPGNYFASGDVQRFSQAADRAITAILRAESGATIGDREMESYRKQLIPQPGDKTETVRAKMAALHSAIERLMVASGPAATAYKPPGTVQTKSPPRTDDPLKDYKPGWRARQ